MRYLDVVSLLTVRSASRMSQAALGARVSRCLSYGLASLHLADDSCSLLHQLPYGPPTALTSPSCWSLQSPFIADCLAATCSVYLDDAALTSLSNVDMPGCRLTYEIQLIITTGQSEVPILYFPSKLPLRIGDPDPICSNKLRPHLRTEYCDAAENNTT